MRNNLPVHSKVPGPKSDPAQDHRADAHRTAEKSPSETALPWALELANGKRCSLFTGATAPVAGMRINYGCPGGFQVVGDIDRSASTWRIFFQAENSSVLEQVDIAVAWY